MRARTTAYALHLHRSALASAANAAPRLTGRAQSQPTQRVSLGMIGDARLGLPASLALDSGTAAHVSGKGSGRCVRDSDARAILQAFPNMGSCQ